MATLTIIKYYGRTQGKVEIITEGINAALGVVKDAVDGPKGKMGQIEEFTIWPNYNGDR